MVNYYELPLLLTADVTDTYKKIREIVEKNSKYASILVDENLIITIIGLRGNSKFYFKVYNPILDRKNNNRILYRISHTPNSSVSIEEKTLQTVGGSVTKVLNIWLGMLRQYDGINIHPNDNITDHYEDEFDDWFEIVEDDADKKPFDTPRQILITGVINKSILQLKEAGFEDEEIIKEATELKKDISKLTMKQAFDSVKRLYAKLKIKGGMENVKLVYDVCKKEVIKMGFHLGTKALGKKMLTIMEAYEII